MAEQLHGVLREVVVVNQGTTHPVVSNLFGGDLQALHADAEGLRPDWRDLPSVRLNPADPAATMVLNAMVLEPERQIALLREAIETGTASATGEASLGLARALIEIGEHDDAEACLAQVQSETPRDWRVTWYRGMSLLVQTRSAESQHVFDRLYSELSGELAPKLALAFSAELAGDMEMAGRLYEVVASTDSTFTSACFGLARVRRAQGDRLGAADAYQMVPRTSRLHTLAQLSLARMLIERDVSGLPVVDDLVRASVVIERLTLDTGERAQLATELLCAALEALVGHAAEPSDALLLGSPFQEVPIREAIERAFRELARLATPDRKIDLVDLANQYRPMTPA
jgi:serine/threonine-protein kinase PknG